MTAGAIDQSRPPHLSLLFLTVFLKCFLSSPVRVHLGLFLNFSQFLPPATLHLPSHLYFWNPATPSPFPLGTNLFAELNCTKKSPALWVLRGLGTLPLERVNTELKKEMWR